MHSRKKDAECIAEEITQHLKKEKWEKIWLHFVWGYIWKSPAQAIMLLHITTNSRDMEKYALQNSSSHFWLFLQNYHDFLGSHVFGWTPWLVWELTLNRLHIMLSNERQQQQHPPLSLLIPFQKHWLSLWNLKGESKSWSHQETVIIMAQQLSSQ